MIRLLIAEDQDLVRGVLAALLRMEEDIEVVAVAADGEAAWQAIVRDCPDVALLDIEMPKASGLEIIERIRADALPCRPLIVTTFARSGYLERAVQAGVWGYLLKDARIEEVVDAIRWVHAGQKVMSPDLLLEAISSPNPLSARELDVLRHVQKGLSTREVAKLLFLSEGTVRNYLSDVIAKLCCTTRQDAVRIAEERGWL